VLQVVQRREPLDGPLEGRVRGDVVHTLAAQPDLARALAEVLDELLT